MSDPGDRVTRVGHSKVDETDVYAGRGPDGANMISADPGERGWLGNPFTLEDHDREESIERFRVNFRARLNGDREFREAVKDLSGKTLGCWCQRLHDDVPACHAEVIAEYADELASNQEATA